MLRLVYTFFTGLLLATFVGMGIATFYEAPKAPEYPVELEGVRVNVYQKGPYPAYEGNPELKEPTEEQRRIADEHKAAIEKYETDQNRYVRNVSITALAAAIVYVTISLLAHTQLGILADGFLLGGFFTLFYSIIRGFETQDNQYRFAIVTIGLLIALALGYLKFVKPDGTRRAS